MSASGALHQCVDLILVVENCTRQKKRKHGDVWSGHTCFQRVKHHTSPQNSRHNTPQHHSNTTTTLHENRDRQRRRRREERKNTCGVWFFFVHLKSSSINFHFLQCILAGFFSADQFFCIITFFVLLFLLGYS